MNNQTNNPLNAGYWQNNDLSYSDGPLNRIHVSLISLVPDSTFGVVGPMGMFGHGAYVPPPFALPRATPQPLMQNLAHSTFAIPRPRSTSQTRSEADPIPLRVEENKGLEKLRKEIYNPRLRRVSLYYRNYYDSPSRSRDNEDDGKRCAVCLDDFEAMETVTLTPCNHMFHDKCIVPWVKSHGQCPVCRFVIYEHERTPRAGNNSESGNDPFARDLITFIRDMETRG